MLEAAASLKLSKSGPAQCLDRRRRGNLLCASLWSIMERKQNIKIIQILSNRILHIFIYLDLEAKFEGEAWFEEANLPIFLVPF